MNDSQSGPPQPATSDGPMVSIVVPCYNEEAVIGNSYKRIDDACRAQGIAYEVIFGNDGSTDKTLELIQSLAEAEPAVKITSHYPNRGAGYTYREMYDSARGDIIVQMDADMAMPPEIGLPKLLESLAGADMAIGSRYAGVRADYPLKRRVFSRGYIMFTRLLFNLEVTDTQTGFLAFYKKILTALDPRSDGFEFLVEFIAQAHAGGYKVVEVGLPWHHDTTSGETDVWRESTKMLLGTLRARRRFVEFKRGRRGLGKSA